jgi:hypothetical protein
MQGGPFSLRALDVWQETTKSPREFVISVAPGLPRPVLMSANTELEYKAGEVFVPVFTSNTNDPSAHLHDFGAGLALPNGTYRFGLSTTSGTNRAYLAGYKAPATAPPSPSAFDHYLPQDRLWNMSNAFGTGELTVPAGRAYMITMLDGSLIKRNADGSWPAVTIVDTLGQVRMPGYKLNPGTYRLVGRLAYGYILQS